MFRNRIPAPQSIYPVYGIVVAIFYAWSLYWFLWNLPAWMLFQTMGEVFTVFCYMMTIDLLESLVLLAALIIVAALLPPTWLRDDFVFSGSLAAGGILVFLMYVTLHGANPKLLSFSPLVLVPVISGRLVDARASLLRKLVVGLAGRCAVFLYLVIPISLLSAMIVGFRNLF